MFIKRIFLSTFFFLTALFIACGPREIQFSVKGTEENLEALSREAAAGMLDAKGPEKLEYRFSQPVSVPYPATIEIEYSFGKNSLDASSAIIPPQYFLKIEGDAWVLPYSSADLIFHYAIPFDNAFLQNFSVSIEKQNYQDGTLPFLQIHSIEIKERWYGYRRFINEQGEHLQISAFVSSGFDEQYEDTAFSFDLPDLFDVSPEFCMDFTADLETGNRAALIAGTRLFEISPHLNQMNLLMFMPNNEIVLLGDRFQSFSIKYSEKPVFPMPIDADPSLILAWPVSLWRDRHYEIFRWATFPSLLIFDFADYAMQDKMLKRLAFFVEKAGFQGRIASDREIEHLHGWNAHDYRAHDLARFFQLAEKENFSLLAEELELKQILFNEGIIVKNAVNEIEAGEGGIISITRESNDYLRARFMAHEGFHGIFFTDTDFRDFCNRRWQEAPSNVRQLITWLFAEYRYETSDEYLMANEFMAYMLQQPVSEVGNYFTNELPTRFANRSWKRQFDAQYRSPGALAALYAAFTREAEAFNEYVGSRWGFSGGTVNSITVKRQ